MNDNSEKSEPRIRAIDEMVGHPEHELRRMLADLHREYQALTAPIIKALADYEALRPRPPVILSMPPDEHLIARIHEAGISALLEGTGGLRLAVNPAMPEGEALVIGANVVRVVNMYAPREPEEQHACAKSLDSRKSQQ